MPQTTIYLKLLGARFELKSTSCRNVLHVFKEHKDKLYISTIKLLKS